MFEENFFWGAVAKASARSVVHKSFDTPHCLRGDRSEVDSFGEELSNETVGVFVRTTLVRTTRIGEVSAGAVRLLHEMAACKLAAVVKGERPPLPVGKFCEGLLESLMHMSRGLVLDQLQAQEA